MSGGSTSSIGIFIIMNAVRCLHRIHSGFSSLLFSHSIRGNKRISSSILISYYFFFLFRSNCEIFRSIRYAADSLVILSHSGISLTWIDVVFGRTETGYDSNFSIKYFGLHMRRACSNNTHLKIQWFARRQLKRTYLFQLLAHTYSTS